jgi:hypothetical protein
MQAKYKKLFFWSSLGSIAVGATIALARRQKQAPYPPLACRKIPRAALGVHLWTERFEVNDGGTRQYVHDRYFLQPTHFKVWSVLDLSFRSSPGRSVPEGAAIYHVTQLRAVENTDANQHEEFMLDRFYGIVTVTEAAGRRSCGVNAIARGGILEIRKCYVGGTNNGVESGEVHRSIGRILNYRFEMPEV